MLGALTGPSRCPAGMYGIGCLCLFCRRFAGRRRRPAGLLVRQPHPPRSGWSSVSIPISPPRICELGWSNCPSAPQSRRQRGHDKANAEFILKKFREWGWDASIERFFPCCTRRRARNCWNSSHPRISSPSLREPPVEGRLPPRSKPRMNCRPINVYGADGDVTAELIYVNQGMPDDYKELERQGLSVKGRIVPPLATAAAGED